MELADLIKKARNKAGLTQVELAEKLGISQGTIGQYETKEGEIGKDGKLKKTSKPSLDKLPYLAEILGVDVTYFFPNSAENKKAIVKQELKSNLNEYLPYLPENLQLKDFVLVKKLGILAGAGSFGEWDEEFLDGNGVVAIEKRILGKVNPINVRTIEIIGDSMEPDFHEGDVAIVDMVNCRYDFIKIAGIYIVRSDNAVYIKRVEFLPNGGLKLISLNPKYGDIELSPDENFEIIGKICGKISYQITKGLIFDNQGIN